MIIGIPVDEKSSNGHVSEHFGRAKYFLVLSTEKNESTFIDNDAMDAPGGAGIKAAQVIVDAKLDALISPRLGKNAFEVIDAANITIYESKGKTVEENLQALKEGKLVPLNHGHEGFHGNGGH